MNKNNGKTEAKGLSKDRISTLHSILIENILCRVPIRDAVRTSILSRNWRFNWATIPKLVFDVNDMFGKSNEEHHLEQPRNKSKQSTEMCKVICAIHQVLLLHHGPILAFTLTMKANNKCVEIDQILLHLSKKNTLKKLTLHFLDYDSYKVPSSVFSFHQLVELSLKSCELDLNLAFGRLPSLTCLSLTEVTIYKETFPYPDLNGLGSLTSLSLIDVYMHRETFMHLVSTSPLLKHLTGLRLMDLEAEPYQNLKFEIIELLKFLPAIEQLHMHWYNFRDGPDNYNISVDDYSDIWLEHLHELNFNFFFNSELELEFVKLIFARSPTLKKLKIRLLDFVEYDDELDMLRILIRCQRASPVAEIIVERESS